MPLSDLLTSRSRSTQPLDLHTAVPSGITAPVSRADLGIEESAIAVALATDPPSAGDARRFVYFVALLEALKRPVVGVLHEASWNLDRASRWASAAGPRWRFLVLHEPLDACWGAVDLAAIVAAPWVLDHDMNLLRERHTRMVQRAHAAGTPVIWAGSGQPESAYPDSHIQALRSPTDQPHRLASQAVSILSEEQTLRAASAAVRAHAGGHDHDAS